MDIIAISVPVVAIITLAFAYSLSSWIGKIEEGTDQMKAISQDINTCTLEFFRKEYKKLIAVILILFLFLAFAVSFTIAFLYIIGVLFSALAVLSGIRAATKGCVRTANSAMVNGMNTAYRITFRGGAVAGLSFVGLGLLCMGGIFVLLGKDGYSAIAGLGLGASTVALFIRTGGGMFAKAAQIGAELAGHDREDDISGSDLRNPASIAVHVGVNIDEVGGMVSDLFESYAGALLAAITLAAVIPIVNPVFGKAFSLEPLEGAVYPLLLCTIGIVASVIGTMFFRGNENRNPVYVLGMGNYISSGVVLLFAVVLSKVFFGSFNCAVAVITGIIIGIVIGKLTELFTSNEHHHRKKISYHAKAAAAPITSGFGIGMLSTFWPILLIVLGIFIAYGFAGFYGIALAATGMLTTIAMVIAVNTFGPVAHHAVGIAKMSNLSKGAIDTVDKLDAFGKIFTVKGKAFQIGSAALTSLALYAAYSYVAQLETVNLLKPVVIAGLLIGAVLPFLFAGQMANSAGHASYQLLDEVKQQLTEDSEITAGASHPNYIKCVDITANAVSRKALTPALIAILTPLAAGILLGTEALGGLLAGSLASGMLLAIMMVNSREVSRKESVFTAADPLMDTAGLAVNILVKLMNMEALAFAPWLLKIGGLL